jgi:hypothetical protein
VAKLLLIVMLAGALAKGLASPAEPPLLIDAPRPAPSLDASR